MQLDYGTEQFNQMQCNWPKLSLQKSELFRREKTTKETPLKEAINQSNAMRRTMLHTYLPLPTHQPASFNPLIFSFPFIPVSYTPPSPSTHFPYLLDLPFLVHFEYILVRQAHYYFSFYIVSYSWNGSSLEANFLLKSPIFFPDPCFPLSYIFPFLYFFLYFQSFLSSSSTPRRQCFFQCDNPRHFSRASQTPLSLKMNVIVRAPQLIFRLFFIFFFSLITLNMFYFLYFFSRPCLKE